jgi:hypothetical protein
MDEFAQNLQEHIAQRAPLHYNADQLKRMRRQAVEREPDYQRRLAEINDKLQQNRFRKRSQHTIFCGYTNGYSKEGPGQLVFIETDKHNNKCFKRCAHSDRLERVNARQIGIDYGFDEYTARAVAAQRYNQARALEVLELSGGMSRSEAVMAARHPSAWMAAVALAKDKRIYVGDDVEPTDQDELDAQAAGLQIFEEYKRIYACADLQPETVAHALSFYQACRVQFLDGWSPDDHLDFWVLRYSELMTHHRGVLAGTIDNISQKFDKHKYTTMRIANEVMTSPRLVHFQQHVINSHNHHEVECLSLIARADAVPTTYDHPEDRMMFREPVTRPLWTPPTDFTHRDAWIRVFYPDLKDVAQIPYYSPRVLSIDSPHNPEESIETQSIKIKLRQIERRFAQWPDDVVVFLALDKVRLAAAEGNYEEMCLLAQRVNMMMGVQDSDADEDALEVDEILEEEDNVVDDLFEELARAEESEEEEEEEKVVADGSDEEEDDTGMRY